MMADTPARSKIAATTIHGRSFDLLRAPDPARVRARCWPDGGPGRGGGGERCCSVAATTPAGAIAGPGPGGPIGPGPGGREAPGGPDVPGGPGGLAGPRYGA